MKQKLATMDGNEAAATIAYKTNEVIAIYPITPASSMGELADSWRSDGDKNVWGQTPTVIEMQSEGGAAGAIHGALQAGSLCSTFTSSQGLLLMIPNMFHIAGELTPAVIHVSSRVVGSHGVSIYVEHNDVMACRSTGFGFLFSNCVQEVYDMALVAQAAALESRVPFLHVFDGFRTSHEVAKIETLTDEEISSLIDPAWIERHRDDALRPEHPVVRGTVQNSDIYWQGREAAHPFHAATPGIVQGAMDRLAKLTGRQYHLYEYVGAPDAERVIVLMGSACQTVEQTVDHLVRQGEKVGLIKVRLYRPFSKELFAAALPPTVRSIAALDRCKEPGSAGEPLYLDVMASVAEGAMSATAPFQGLPRVIGGRYGIAGKEFTPAMVKRIFEELGKDSPKNHFVIGIEDDVSGNSLDYAPAYSAEPEGVVSAVFWGLGADGTVSANKNTIKIIGEQTENHVQGYFLYDSKKSGSITESHLRFGAHPILSTYLIEQADFVGVHQFGLVHVRPVLNRAKQGATVLLNSSYGPDLVWDHLPRDFQQQVVDKQLKLYVLDGYSVAREVSLGSRISAIMQTAFFALSGILPQEEALDKIRKAVAKAYAHRGADTVEKNMRAIDLTLARLHAVKTPDKATSTLEPVPPVLPEAPEIVQTLIAPQIAGRGDLLPVSAFGPDGTFPSATTQWEKRNIAAEAPIWAPDLCTQCGRCVLVCPHQVIRAKIAPNEGLAAAPEGFPRAKAKWSEFREQNFVLGISAADCTGCGACVEACPGRDRSDASRKALNMAKRPEDRSGEVAAWRFFQSLPEADRHGGPLEYRSVRNIQLLPPLFEFSGACAGCGETPYFKLATQLFGDRMLIANAAGCSAVYAGSMPTVPFTTDAEGRGPTYNFSLFEDNAEFGFGYRLAVDQQTDRAHDLLARLAAGLDPGLVERLTAEDLPVRERWAAIAELKATLAHIPGHEARDLAQLADHFVPRSIWSVGGDGWAYDIGFAGVDHVLASGLNVNMLVMDTEVYSNTGGQASKATARGAVAKFAAAGKPSRKKDLGRTMMAYGNVYVAQVAIGASDAQCVKAMLEAESYAGPSLIIAYSHCIAHGFDLRLGNRQQELAVKSGHWPLYRFDPRRTEQGKNPFQLDSKEPSIPLEEYLYNENRYRILQQTHPEAASKLLQQAKEDVADRWKAYMRLAAD